MDEGFTKHLELIQTIVARMAGNSFLIKGWTVTVSAALFALAAKDSNRAFALIALLPAISFWGLDAYYLRQERLFRKLYEGIRRSAGMPRNPADAFSLAPGKYARETPSWFGTLWAPTVIAIHGVVVVAVVAVIVTLTWFR